MTRVIQALHCHPPPHPHRRAVHHDRSSVSIGIDHSMSPVINGDDHKRARSSRLSVITRELRTRVQMLRLPRQQRDALSVRRDAATSTSDACVTDARHSCQLQKRKIRDTHNSVTVHRESQCLRFQDINTFITCILIRNIILMS